MIFKVEDGEEWEEGVNEKDIIQDDIEENEASTSHADVYRNSSDLWK